jgi:FkbM family methyltransferase
MLSIFKKVTSFYLDRFPKRMMDLLKPAIFAVARPIMILAGSKIQVSEYTMYLDARDTTGLSYFICNYMFGAPSLEHLEIKLFLDLIAANSDTVVVDVGSNYGYYTLEACTVLPSEGTVIAIEPDKKVFACLSRSVRYNSLEDRVTLANVAISDTDGEKMMLSCERRESALNKAVAYVPVDSSCTDIVDSRTLDSLTTQYCLPSEHKFVIKIDIEGSEPFAFAGMHEILTTSRGYVVLFEFTPHSVASSGHDPLQFGRSVLKLEPDLIAEIDEVSCTLNPLKVVEDWEELIRRTKLYPRGDTNILVSKNMSLPKSLLDLLP